LAAVNLPRVTERAQLLAQEVLRAGDIAMDGTAGKGRDTACLAQAVGASGHVHAFDIQPEALAATGNLLRLAGLADRVTLHACSHADLTAVLPAAHRGRLGAALFNLGYLPGGNTAIITRPDSTARALRAAYAELRPGGRLICVAYTGHPGGDDEAGVVRAFGREHTLAGDTVAMDTAEAGSGRPWILCVTRPA
jgi:predicted methyltransferase